MEESLKNLFEICFARFLESEKENIANGTSERNLCARFAMILQDEANKAGLHGYYADPEYNRKQDGRIKTIVDDNEHIVNITCDLILHSRGANKKLDNLIAIEMKRESRRDADKELDRVRLRALTMESYNRVWSADGGTDPEHVCNYQVGYYLEIGSKERKIVVEEYRKGAQVAEQVRNY